MAHADNALVTPQVFHMPRAIDSRTQDKQQISQRGIPVTVTAVLAEGKVTVKAEMQSGSPYNIHTFTVPIAYSQYVRSAIAVGDHGLVFAGDYYIGGVTGLGGGTAGFHYTANLTSATFHPVSNTSWSSRDMGKSQIGGPKGAILQDNGANGMVVVDQPNKKIYVNPKASGWNVYIGGDGSTGSYAPIAVMVGGVPTAALPNIMARYA